MRALSIIAVVCSVASSATAQEPYFEALGQAPVVAGDRVRARERALDEALRQAVEQAVATVLTPDELVTRASQLKLRIYPRARSFIGTYRVLDEGEQNGVFQVHLSAQVGTGMLQRELGAGTTTGLPRLSQKLRGMVCIDVTGIDGNPAPEQVTLAEKVVRELLSARNVEVVPRPRDCMEDAIIQSLKGEAAQAAVAGKALVTAGGPIRGTDQVGAHAKVTLRLIDVDGRVSGQAEAERDAYGAEAAGGNGAGPIGVREAIGEAARAMTPAIAAKWAGVTASGGVSVRIGGIGRYADYQAVVRAIQGLPGVAAVEPRRFVRGEANLLVRTASAAGQLAAGLTRVPPQGVRVSVTTGPEGVLNVEITGEGAVVPERG
jgi:hypothetical protein